MSTFEFVVILASLLVLHDIIITYINVKHSKRIENTEDNERNEDEEEKENESK